MLQSYIPELQLDIELVWLSRLLPPQDSEVAQLQPVALHPARRPRHHHANRVNLRPRGWAAQVSQDTIKHFHISLMFLISLYGILLTS